MVLSPKKKPSFPALLGVLCVVSLLFYLSYLELVANSVFLKTLKNSIHQSIYPINQFFIENLSNINKKNKKIEEVEQLKSELESTQQELLLYKNAFNRLEQIRKEKQELENILSLQKKLPYKTIVARVIAKDPQNLFSTININKGRKNGVVAGMPVIAFQGDKEALVGKIYQVNSKQSKVITINDYRYSLGIKIKNNPNTSILNGNFPKSYFPIVEYLNINLKDLLGKEIVTSSLGEIYPDNIPIGIISKVIKKNYDFFQSAEVEPFINLFEIKTVFVYIK